tara:strand:- start:517 stop:822 length:306 start_codon:yes stop_codon:yes gene_type:complete
MRKSVQYTTSNQWIKNVAKVEIYTAPLCEFCHRAKRLFSQKNVEFTEVDVIIQPEQKKLMVTRANGATSVPQIFIGDQHVGGCDDLFALEAAGKLDPMLER